ncbi:MAG: cytochrome c-type biogenesis protein CcmH [Caldilineales bacterium]|nr:cytochrome c-type biogenesis protein CcmH [Caldilineales bacterium]
MRRRLFFLVPVLLLALLIAGPAQAQSGDPGLFPTDNDVNVIAKKLYCPVCPNTPLDVCETLACKDWRQQIRNQLSAGWSEGQIIDYFVEQYGQRVLAEPERRGFTSFVWVLPILLALIALFVAALILNSWLTPPVAQSSEAHISVIPPEKIAQIEQELREMY